MLKHLKIPDFSIEESSLILLKYGWYIPARIEMKKIAQLIELIKSAVAEAVKESNGVNDHSNVMSFKDTCSFLRIHSSTFNKWKATNNIELLGAFN